MRASMTAEAVAREPWPKESRAAICFSWGGIEGSWEVDRRRARWRERVLRLERRAALLSEALSLIAPTSSLSTVLRPIAECRVNAPTPLFMRNRSF